jgi:hypothetical protein
VQDMMLKIDANAVSGFLLQQELVEPVVINRQGEPHAVMIPYEIFREMHKNSRQALGAGELTDEDIEAIINSKPSPESSKYNDELED